ncbi:MAG: hypothetical protein ACLFU8_18015 [Anaerolineales bacterium]
MRKVWLLSVVLTALLAGCGLLPDRSTALQETLPTLSVLPLEEGRRWVYRYDAYVGEAEASYVYTDTVHEVINEDTYIAARVEREVAVLEEPGEALFIAPETESFWYVLLKDGRIYRQAELDLEELDKRGTLEYRLPFNPQRCWYSDPQQRANLAAAAVDYPGCRRPSEPQSMSTAVGDFERCYVILTPYNSGGVFEELCEGVGVVGTHYDHAGSRFGYQATLIETYP